MPRNATDALKRNPGIFKTEKINDTARKRRFWDAGAHINGEGNYEIYRGPDSGSKVRGHASLTGKNNKNLVLRNEDTDNNPVALEIIQAGSGNAIEIRSEIGGSITGRLDKNGNVHGSSSASVKENIKNMSDDRARKILEGVDVKTFNYIGDPAKAVGPIAENWHEVTGLDSNKSISINNVAGLTLRLLKLVYHDLNKLKKEIVPQEPSEGE